jgi:hypothetical protein
VVVPELGLAAALALVAACGHRVADDVQEGGEGQEVTSDGPATGGGGAMCTQEAYLDHDDRLEHLGFDCVDPLVDGTCPPCDEACIDVILRGCPLETCGLPDLPCSSGCTERKVLCQEEHAGQCCYAVTASQGNIPGRPVREHGAPLLPLLHVEPGLHVEPRRAAAAMAYREIARHERASVEAFLEAAAVLEAWGAPPELLDAHRRAAAEEHRHALAALAAAEALDGRRARLGDTPTRTVPHERSSFAWDLVRDGCFGEAFAAGEAAWALRQPAVSDCPELLRYWRRVCVEEREHARLAWRTLEWLLDDGHFDAAVIDAAIRAAIRRAEGKRSSELEPFGLPSSQTSHRIETDTVAAMVAAAHRTVDRTAELA